MVNGMNVGLILDFGTHVDGAWVYKDPAQCTLAQMTREVLAWDLVPFDAWLYGPGHWRSYPKVRQHLMGLREQLTHAYFAHAGNESEQGQRIRDYFRETRRLTLRMENLPPSLRSAIAMVDKKTTRRLTSDHQARNLRRLQQEYAERVRSGQKYGAQTELARKYGLPLHTVRRSLKTSHTP
jgi:hypothetical protein